MIEVVDGQPAPKGAGRGVRAYKDGRASRDQEADGAAPEGVPEIGGDAGAQIHEVGDDVGWEADGVPQVPSSEACCSGVAQAVVEIMLQLERSVVAIRGYQGCVANNPQDSADGVGRYRAARGMWDQNSVEEDSQLVALFWRPRDSQAA